MSTSTHSSGTGARPVPPAGGQPRRKPLGSSLVLLTVGVAAALLVLAAIFNANTPSTVGSGDAGAYNFAVGQPGPGETAPDFTLPSTDGGSLALDAYEGQDVLLYFQEGLMCQPCWDQLKDIEQRREEFQAAGVDEIVSVTTDPLPALERKVDLEGLRSPVLSDRDLAVSKAYDTNAYGMMGGSHNGHSFILVGPSGDIRWRADYGGAPDYTMYLPVDNLLADLRAGLDADTGS